VTHQAPTVEDVHDVFAAWLGPQYDMQFLTVVLAAAAAGLHLPGDPAWLQCVGGPGVGKTETLMALTGSGAHVVSTITGEAALLSGTPARSRAKNATGGLLRQIGSSGLLVVKDFTSILSLNRDTRNGVLAALREVYDGHWTRNTGTDGGMALTWAGRIAVISGVTGAYDEHHSVITSMGDRFLILRLASEDHDVRQHATRQALSNSGGEDGMRQQLAAVVAGLLLNLRPPQPPDPAPADLIDELVNLADIVTRARSEVAKDWKGDPEYAHAPEMPTRLAKQLLQTYRGARLIGLPDRSARMIPRRLAHDSIPPGRRVTLLDVIDHPGTTTSAVVKRTGMSWHSVDRRLQELAMHKLVLKSDADEAARGWRWTAPTEVAAAAEVLRDGYGTQP
jgi:hypothetical protein